MPHLVRPGGPLPLVDERYPRPDLIGELDLTPEEGVAAATGDVEVLECRRLGGTWTLDRVWERLGGRTAIRKPADGRWLDGVAVERVVFALSRSGRPTASSRAPSGSGSGSRSRI